MNDRVYSRIKALLTAGLGFYLLLKVLDGTVLFYINQRFVWLVIVAGIVLIIAAQVVFNQRIKLHQAGDPDHHTHQHDHDHDHSSTHPRYSDLVWLLIPLSIGFLIPAKPLSAGAITSKGLSLTAPQGIRAGDTMVLDISPENRSILEWVKVFNHSNNPQEFDGQPVNISGFIFRDYRLAEDQVFVGRFIVTCCAADATAVGLIVQSDVASQFPDSTWVSVNGTMTTIDFNGEILPYVISDGIEQIPEPPQPYLYP